jgi:hypothetical protein
MAEAGSDASTVRTSALGAMVGALGAMVGALGAIVGALGVPDPKSDMRTASRALVESSATDVAGRTSSSKEGT